MKILQKISGRLVVTFTVLLTAFGSYAADSVDTLKARVTAMQQAVSMASQTLQGKVGDLNGNPNYASLNSYYKRAMDLNISAGQFDSNVIAARADWVEATYNKMREFRGKTNGASNFNAWYQQNYGAIEANYIQTLAHARNRATYLSGRDETTTRNVNGLFTRISAAEVKIEQEMPTALPWLDFVVASEYESATTPATKTVLMYGEGQSHWRVKDATNTNWSFNCGNALMGDPSDRNYKVCVLLPYDYLAKSANKCAEAGQWCRPNHQYWYVSTDTNLGNFSGSASWRDSDFKCDTRGACYVLPLTGPFSNIYESFKNTWPRIVQ
jgi:hypothetical protein